MAACHQSRHDGHYFSYGVSYTLALQVKLSELILALKDADNRIAAIEESSDEELQTAHEEIKERALHQN
jgi:low affinity Fe/Cu permease